MRSRDLANVRLLRSQCVDTGGVKLYQAMKGQDALLLWCQRNTEGYQGVQVKNFHTSWADGLAFCALIHKHRPDRIQFDQLSKDNKAHNLGLAFKVAEELGIPALLDVEDITGIPKPEPLSIITYLSQYYHYFNKKRSSVTLDAEQDKKQKTDENNNQNQRSVPQEPEKIPETAEEHGVCAKCGKELEGPVIEAVGKAYHEECFGCFGCGKALLGKCLSVDNNPYCESCGRKAFIESRLKKQRTPQKEPQPEPKKEEEQTPSTSATETESSSSSSGSKAGRWGGVALFGMAKPQETPKEPQPEQQPSTTQEHPTSQEQPSSTTPAEQEAPKEQPAPQTQQPPALPPKHRVQEPSSEQPTPETKAAPKPSRPAAPIPKNNAPDDDDDAPPTKPPPRPIPSKASTPPTSTQEVPKEQASQPSETQPSSTESAQPPPLPRKPTAKPPVPSKPANAAQLVATAQTTPSTQQEQKKEKPALPAKPAKPQTIKVDEEEPSTSPPDTANRGSAIDYKKPLPQPSKKKEQPQQEEEGEDAPEVKVRLSYRQSRAIKPADIQAEAKKVAAETQSAFATFPNLEGFLEKKGDVGVIKSWKRRFFKLRGDRMFYYTDESQKDRDEPLGYIPLKDAKNIDPTPRMKGAFQIHTENPTRIWYLKADTDEEMQKWIRGCAIHSHYDSSTAPPKTAATSQNTLLSLKLLSQPKEGYLNKLKGGLSHKISTFSKGSLGQLWSPRYFIVKDGVLFKYETKEAFELGKPASKLPLYKCTLEEYQEEGPEGEPSENMFQITTTKGTIVLRAADEEDMHHWLNAIRKQQIMMDQIINDIIEA